MLMSSCGYKLRFPCHSERSEESRTASVSQEILHSAEFMLSVSKDSVQHDIL